jgi:hypothetical protein
MGMRCWRYKELQLRLVAIRKRVENWLHLEIYKRLIKRSRNFDHSLDFDGDVERKRSHPDRAARVLPTVSKHLDEEIRTPR